MKPMKLLAGLMFLLTLVLAACQPAHAKWYVVEGEFEEQLITEKICEHYGAGANILVQLYETDGAGVREMQLRAAQGAMSYLGMSDQYTAWSMLYSDAAKVHASAINPRMQQLARDNNLSLGGMTSMGAESSCKNRVGSRYVSPKRGWKPEPKTGVRT